MSTYQNLLFFNKSGHQHNIKWNGNYWEGRMLLPEVSQDLFEVEHIFAIERLLNTSSETSYGIPHADLPAAWGNPMGYTAKFTASSTTITTSETLSDELVGARIFSDYAEGIITAISGKTVTLDTAATSSGEGDFSIAAFRTRFESLYNVVDFDEIPNITGSFSSGNNYITSYDDLSLFKKGYQISGQGIPEGTRVHSISGNKINVNKVFTENGSNVTLHTYQIEDSNDVSSRLYQYSLTEDSNYDAPVIMNISERYFPLTYDASEIIVDGYRKTTEIDSNSFSINIALNSDQEALIGRVLILEDITTEIPTTILRMELIGEVVGEDERLNVLLGNIGQEFYKEDSGILRDSDPKEPYPDYLLLNNKRKELLLQASEIFPYLGSYKGLINIIKFFGYQDLRIKEYWLNIQKSAGKTKSALEQNENFLERVKNTPYGESILIDSLHDDENSGKFKQVEIYGKRSDGTFGIKSSLEQIFPSTAYKKTPLFGLFYDINEIVPDEEDEFGYPVTKDSFMFSPEEILIKLFALKEKLKKDYLPLSAKIIDITGEGFYFSVNKTRGWIDTLTIDEISIGKHLDITATPTQGYVEDLRAFQLRTNSSLPPLPYVLGYDDNTDTSTFGNTADVNPYNQQYTPDEAEKLSSAILTYHENLINNNSNLHLGDGDYNGPGYIRYQDSRTYYLPAGFPTVLETTSFQLTMDEIRTSWDNLDKNISTYETTLAGIDPDAPGLVGIIPDLTISQSIKVDSDFLTSITLSLPPGITPSLPVGAKFQLKIYIDSETYLVTELQSYDNTTGDAEVLVLYYKGEGTYDTTWNVTTTNLFSTRVDMSYYNYTQGSDGFYSWDNLRFLGYYEIEWTISKDGDNPYFYQFRGNIKDYWRIPHIFPYVGEYTVKCRVWNSFNDISIGHFNRYIKVEPRNIELTSVTRFREAEEYTWDQMVKTWDDYDSQWIFPLEQQKSQIYPSKRIVSYPEYGNQFNDGQECYVLTTIPETRGSIEFNVGVVSHSIVSISSVYGSGTGPATVTTSTAHNLNPGDSVYIIDNSVSSISGQYSVLSVTSTTFVIPLIVSSPITTPGNYLTGPGTIQISINGREYANVEYGGSIGSFAGVIYTAINGSVKDPHYIVKEYSSTTVSGVPSTVFLYNIVMETPINTGAKYNGEVIDITSDGSIILNLGDTSLLTSISPVIEGGVNEYKDYVYYSPGDDLPVPEMKNWGSKQITWDSMDDITWDQLYAQTLPMYDYHGDWNGGFDLYNVRYGDRIRVGKNTEGVTISSSASPNYPLFLYDVADQLNQSTDPGISKFTYDVRGYSRMERFFNSTGDLVTSVIPTNLTYDQSSLASGNTVARADNMTNGSYRETTATATDGVGTEWVKVDLGEPMYINKVVVGCDFDDVIEGSGGASYTENKDVEYSLDGITWTTLFNTGTFTEGIQNYPADVFARYLRIVSVGARLVVTEFYPMIPFSTEIGPMDATTEKYTTDGFTPTSICKGLNGEIYMAAGTSIYIFKSPTDIEELELDHAGTYIYVDKRNRIWYYGTGSVPLQIIDMAHPDRKIAFISMNGTASGSYKDIEFPVSFVSATVSVLAVDDRKGDFAIKINYGSTTSMMYYDGGIQAFEEFDTSSGLPSVNIRQMEFDYSKGNKVLWIATDNGISLYDRVKFFNYQTTNSGLFSDDVYSICIDEIDNKWIGTDQGITYFDGETWAVWTNSNSPSLSTGASYTNIVTTGHGNIFFTIRDGIGGYKLGYFNGDNFIIYSLNPGSTTTSYSPINSTTYENYWILVNDVKTVDDLYAQYPGNIFYLDSSNDLVHIDYIIPHIHASSKYPGNDGWDFVYYDSSSGLPATQFNPTGLGYGIIDFNFIVGPVDGNYILSDQFRPKFPFVDWYTWKKPHWVNGSDYKGILSAHPNLNEDHLFLHAPLRDILDGSALKEEYWRNPPIERSASRRSRDEFSDFEWLIRLGDSNDDRGMQVTVGKDGYIYVTGFFQGTVFFGSPNSTNSGFATTLTSDNCRSIFVAKYNSSGIIQWARMYGEPSTISPYDYDFTPTSIKLDRFGNVFVVGFKEKNRNNTSSENPTNLLLRWDWNGDVISATELFTPSSSTAFDESFDVVVDDANNLYIAGEFSGTLTSGDLSITSTEAREIYVAKIESNGSVSYLKKIDSGEAEYSPVLALGQYNDLYICYFGSTISTQQIVLSSYNSLTFERSWKKEIVNTDYSLTPLVPSMKLAENGEIVIGVVFNGTLTIGSSSINSPVSLEYAIFKFYTTGNLVYAKNIGNGLGNYLHEIAVDKSGRIYMLGSYTGIFSPDTYSFVNGVTSNGESDILLIKLESDSSIIDIVSIGSIAQDEGLSISLDADENIYLTGYLSGSLETESYVVTSPTSGGKDIFIGKIPKVKFIPGKSMPGPISWMGTQSWGWSDKRIHRNEFEIPIGSTVFINPLDSNIPGKKEHKWKLIEKSTGEVIIDVKDVPYFIWTFRNVGYYDVEIELKDSNGNVYKTYKESYIRVVDHKAIFQGEPVPHSITSNDFKEQAIYPY